jgi:hypothetical protein
MTVRINNHQQSLHTLSKDKRLCAVFLQGVSIQFNAQTRFVGQGELTVSHLKAVVG